MFYCLILIVVVHMLNICSGNARLTQKDACVNGAKMSADLCEGFCLEDATYSDHERRECKKECIAAKVKKMKECHEKFKERLSLK